MLRTWRAGLCSGPLLLPAAHCASGWVEAARWMLSMDLSSRRLQHHSLLLGECCRVMACRHCIMLNGWLPYGRSTSASHGQKGCYSSAWLLLPFLFYVPVSASSSREHHSGGLWRGRLTMCNLAQLPVTPCSPNMLVALATLSCQVGHLLFGKQVALRGVIEGVDFTVYSQVLLSYQLRSSTYTTRQSLSLHVPFKGNVPHIILCAHIQQCESSIPLAILLSSS